MLASMEPAATTMALRPNRLWECHRSTPVFWRDHHWVYDRAGLFNRYYTVQLPPYLGIFCGQRDRFLFSRRCCNFGGACTHRDLATDRKRHSKLLALGGKSENPAPRFLFMDLSSDTSFPLVYITFGTFPSLWKWVSTLTPTPQTCEPVKLHATSAVIPLGETRRRLSVQDVGIARGRNLPCAGRTS